MAVKYKLHAINCGGDQSFAILHPDTGGDDITLDYRKRLSRHNQILTVNVVERMYNADVVASMLIDDDDAASIASTATATTIATYSTASASAHPSHQMAILSSSQLRELQTVFASASCLNASLLDVERHYDTSSRYPGLDIAKARNVQHFLLNVKDDRLIDLIVERMTK